MSTFVSACVYVCFCSFRKFFQTTHCCFVHIPWQKFPLKCVARLWISSGRNNQTENLSSRIVYNGLIFAGLFSLSISFIFTIISMYRNFYTLEIQFVYKHQNRNLFDKISTKTTCRYFFFLCRFLFHISISTHCYFIFSDQLNDCKYFNLLKEKFLHMNLWNTENPMGI